MALNAKNKAAILRLILENASIEDLNEIGRTLNTRSSILQQIATVSITVGQTVKFSRDAKKLGGKTGVVKEINKNSVLVDVDGVQWSGSPTFIVA